MYYFSLSQDTQEDQLFKVVRPIIEMVMKGLNGTWISDKKITIDESMICYLGQF